jgi:hypothetical protein
MEAEKLTVICPCCEAKLVIDRLTGAILAHERPKGGPAKTLEQAMSEEKKRRQEAEDRFAQAVKEHQHRDDLLEKKFQEALKRAEKDGEPPPPRPFEFD